MVIVQIDCELMPQRFIAPHRGFKEKLLHISWEIRPHAQRCPTDGVEKSNSGTHDGPSFSLNDSMKEAGIGTLRPFISNEPEVNSEPSS